MYAQINGSFQRVESIGHPERVSSWGTEGPLWGAYAELIAERSPRATQAEMGGRGEAEHSARKIQLVEALGLGVREQRAASEAAKGKGRVGQWQLWSGTAI